MGIDQESKVPEVYNHAVAFLDLLGQRQYLAGETIIPVDEVGKDQVAKKAARILAAVRRIDSVTDAFLKGFRRKDSPIRQSIPQSDREMFDNLRRENTQTYPLSDGQVYFHSLADPEVKVAVNGAYCILGLAGIQCLNGLAAGCPLRGGVEISWGLEARKGEIHGPALANSYRLESEVAQYPRIVVGDYLVHWLVQNAEQTETDAISGLNKSMADICLKLLSKDVDGWTIVDYLGDGFSKYIEKGASKELREQAYNFVKSSYSHWTSKKNSKLANRYWLAKSYFEKNLKDLG